MAIFNFVMWRLLVFSFCSIFQRKTLRDCLLVKKCAHINQNFGSFFTLVCTYIQSCCCIRSLFHQKVDWSGEKNSFLHMINYSLARDFIWKRIFFQNSYFELWIENNKAVFSICMGKKELNLTFIVYVSRDFIIFK